MQNVSFNMLISHAMTDTKYINNTIIPGKSCKEVSQITPLCKFVNLKNDNKNYLKFLKIFDMI